MPRVLWWRRCQFGTVGAAHIPSVAYPEAGAVYAELETPTVCDAAHDGQCGDFLLVVDFVYLHIQVISEKNMYNKNSILLIGKENCNNELYIIYIHNKLKHFKRARSS